MNKDDLSAYFVLKDKIEKYKSDADGIREILEWIRPEDRDAYRTALNVAITKKEKCEAIFQKVNKRIEMFYDIIDRP